jgi:integrase
MKVLFSFGAISDKSEKTQNINIRVYHSSLDFRATTGLGISRDEWDFKNRRIVDLSKGKRSAERSSYLNEVRIKLELIRSTYESEFLKFSIQGAKRTLDKIEWKNWCREILDSHIAIARTEKNVDNSILSKFNQYIELNRLSWKPNTLKGYLSNVNVLKAFMDYNFLFNSIKEDAEPLRNWYKSTYGNNCAKDFKCTELDLEFYKILEEWFVLRGLRDNYRGSLIQKIKAVIRHFATTENGFEFHQNIRHPSFKTIKKSVESDVLTEDEIEKLFNFRGEYYLENTRDLMLVQYYACLRYNELKSELSKGFDGLNIYKASTDGKEHLQWRIMQNKTSALKTIPIHTRCEHIIFNSYPRIISPQKYNSYIKKLAGKLEFKDKRITTHTLRRSFCTNMFNKNYPLRDIMQYSGHKVESEFLKYVKGESINRDNSIPLM